MAEDLMVALDEPCLAAVLRGRVSCSRDMALTLHLSLTSPLPPNWFKRLGVKLLSDDAKQVYDVHVSRWNGVEDTLVYGVLEIDYATLRRSISEDEIRNISTFTPFQSIQLTAGDGARVIPNQNSLGRFRGRSISPEQALLNDPFFTL